MIWFLRQEMSPRHPNGQMAACRKGYGTAPQDLSRRRGALPGGPAGDPVGSGDRV